MTSRRLFCATALGAALLAGQAMAATWQYLGTSGFSGQIAQHQDNQRAPVNAIIVDAAGYVYASACNRNNNADLGQSGGITIYPPGYNHATNTPPKMNVDLSSIKGSVTKFVIAGDGKVYGVLNWMEPWWQWADGCTGDTNCISSKLVRFEQNGTFTVVYDATPAKTWKDLSPPNVPDGNWRNRITGIAVGNDDGQGFIYFAISGGDDNSLKFRIFYRYNWKTGLVEDAPQNGSSPNDGWGQYPALAGLEYVGRDTATGKDWFAYVTSNRSQAWNLAGMGWGIKRQSPVDGAANTGDSSSGWGRRSILVTAYDPLRKRLWAGGQGDGGTNIMSRWQGLAANSALLLGDGTTAPTGLPVRTGTGNDSGSKNAQVWHTNGWDGAGGANGGAYYVASLAVNPSNGYAWLGYGGQATYAPPDSYPDPTNPTNMIPLKGKLGVVYTVGPDDPGTPANMDEGSPQSAHPDTGKKANRNHVVALTFHADKVYAVTFDTVTAEYNTFWAINDSPTCADPFADVNKDTFVDHQDFGMWQACFSGTGNLSPDDPWHCSHCLDRDFNNKVNSDDFAAFSNCYRGPAILADTACD